MTVLFCLLPALFASFTASLTVPHSDYEKHLAASEQFPAVKQRIDDGSKVVDPAATLPKPSTQNPDLTSSTVTMEQSGSSISAAGLQGVQISNNSNCTIILNPINSTIEISQPAKQKGDVTQAGSNQDPSSADFTTDTKFNKGKQSWKDTLTSGAQEVASTTSEGLFSRGVGVATEKTLSACGVGPNLASVLGEYASLGAKHYPITNPSGALAKTAQGLAGAAVVGAATNGTAKDKVKAVGQAVLSEGARGVLQFAVGMLNPKLGKCAVFAYDCVLGVIRDCKLRWWSPKDNSKSTTDQYATANSTMAQPPPQEYNNSPTDQSTNHNVNQDEQKKNNSNSSIQTTPTEHRVKREKKKGHNKPSKTPKADANQPCCTEITLCSLNCHSQTPLSSLD